MGISLQQAITYAYDAGFRGTPLATIVSISLCECGSQDCQCNPDCCPPCDSCGVLQVYQCAHPGTASCAVNPQCAYTLGWSISNHGTDFHPWTTYQDGCYQRHMGTVSAAINAMPYPIGQQQTSPPPPPPPSPPPNGHQTGSSSVGAPAQVAAILLLMAGGAAIAGAELHHNAPLRHHLEVDLGSAAREGGRAVRYADREARRGLSWVTSR
ncbi:MAG TPA: hypothetical protein VMV23_05445 [Candidatus Nanopelagicaceae bacterium]|nr:hypothetical protein [Candidatus Nanopelagicaceae bacterium]